jgi:hypothetical protein
MAANSTNLLLIHPTTFINIFALYPIGPEVSIATPIEMVSLRVIKQLFSLSLWS